MKLRLHDDSLRLRLSQSEVRSLQDGNTLEMTTRFGPEPAQQLMFRLEPGGATISASLVATTITLRIPIAEIGKWAASTALSLEHEQLWNRGTLRILVEKDLDTRRGPGVNQDAFPNPRTPGR